MYSHKNKFHFISSNSFKMIHDSPCGSYADEIKKKPFKLPLVRLTSTSVFEVFE